jgi:pimeloyl-ACP methyl ester carboxylesterase
MTHPTYRTANVDGYEVFYREAGDRSKPTLLLLLHGFPTAGHMFRDLIPLLADRFHLVAPDLPGFGRSALPARDKFAYTFDNLAKVIDGFTEVIGLDRFAIYIFDYGAPIGLRLAVAHPERITAIISQNGNAYKEGLSDGWNPIERYWRDPSDANRQALRKLLTPASIRWQYEFATTRAATPISAPANSVSSLATTRWSRGMLWLMTATTRPAGPAPSGRDAPRTAIAGSAVGLMRRYSTAWPNVWRRGPSCSKCGARPLSTRSAASSNG